MDDKNIENIKEELAKKLEGQITQFIGSPINDFIKNEVLKTVSDYTTLALKNTSCIDEVGKVETEILWKKMSVKDKFKWFMYNRFPFKKQGQESRNAIDNINQENYIVDNNATWIQYPDYLQPNPKSVICIDATLKLAKPLEFITYKIDT